MPLSFDHAEMAREFELARFEIHFLNQSIDLVCEILSLPVASCKLVR